MWTIYVLGPLLLQVFALVHFIKYRSGNTIWLFIIIFLGPIGALVYIIVEVLPELRATQSSSGWLAKKRRITQLQAQVLDNPSPGNYEELADLYFQQKDYPRARECYDRAITSRTDHPDPFYGRALSALYSGDPARALPDLEKVVAMDRKHDYNRALGLLAFCYAETGQPARAEQLFREALTTSTLSETEFHFARFLAAQGKRDEARSLAENLIRKRATVAGPLRRADREWFRRAESLLKELNASAPAR